MRALRPRAACVEATLGFIITTFDLSLFLIIIILIDYDFLFFVVDGLFSRVQSLVFTCWSLGIGDSDGSGAGCALCALVQPALRQL